MVSSCCKMSWHTCTRCSCSSLKSLETTFAQVFCDDYLHHFAVHVQLIFNHFYSWMAISVFLQADTLNIFLRPLCTISGVILPFLNVCHSKARAVDIVSSPFTSCGDQNASVEVFLSQTSNFKLLVLCSWC